MHIDSTMSDSDYQLADQFLLEQSNHNDTSGGVSLGKRIVQVDDVNGGSYGSNYVNFDFLQKLAGSKGLASSKDGTLLLPYPVTMRNMSTDKTFNNSVNRYCVTLKSGVWNVIDSLSVELGGVSLLTEGDFKLFWNNVRHLAQWDINDLKKLGPDCYFSPDDWVSMGFSNGQAPFSATAHGDGFFNNQTNTTAATGLVPEISQASANSGFVERAYNNPMPVGGIDQKGNEFGLNTYGWPTQRSAAAKAIALQHGKGAFMTTGYINGSNVVSTDSPGTITSPDPNTATTSGAYPNTNAATWYHMLKIRLVDLHPIFEKLDLIGNPSLKIKLKINTGYVDIDTSCTATGSSPNYTYSYKMNLAGCTMTSGQTCPIMIASAAPGNAMYGIPTASITSTAVTGKFRVAFGALQNSLTTYQVAGAFYPFQNARIMLPVYDIADQASIVARPIKRTTFLDCHAQIYRGYGGKGLQTSQFSQPFNLQISGAYRNVKFVCLLPFPDTTTNYWTSANAAGVDSFKSPFDSCPATVQPGSCIRSFQVQVGNQFVFPRGVDYDYEMYHEEFRKLLALNGSLTHEMSNGLLDAIKWSSTNRVMIADCSRISNKDVSQSIVVTGTNVSCQGTDFVVLVITERDLEFNRITGETVVGLM